MRTFCATRRKLLIAAPAVLLARPSRAQLLTRSAGEGRLAAPPASALTISKGAGPYLVNGLNQPFLMMADSAQNLMGGLVPSDAQFYFSTRGSQGFNAIQFDVVSTPYVSNKNANHATPDGIAPFSSALIRSTPNATYFARVDQYVNLCAQNNMVAILNPYESASPSGGGLPELVAAGTAACLAYGTYLGNRYKNFPNVMWQLGNDCIITTQAQFNVMQAMAQGLRAGGDNHLMTIELEFPESTAFEATGFGTFASLMNMNGAYTYGPTYGECLVAYNAGSVSFAGKAGTNTTPQCPSIMLEANYEFEHNDGTDGGSTLNLRKQSYWTVLGGNSGQIYGAGGIWNFAGSWQSALVTTGVKHMVIWKNLFESVGWQDLIPDQTHVFGTAGYGTPAITGLFASNNYVALSAKANGTCAVTYFPLGSGNTLTINMAKFAGLVRAQWFDPANGSYTAVAGSPFTNSGRHNFSPVGKNSAGDPDWVLLFTA